MKYTNIDWKEFKKAMGLKNKDIAEILGIEKHSVDVATMPKNRKLPLWARLAIWTYQTTKQKQ